VRRPRDERGESLIEVMLATVILAAVGLAVFAALTASISVSEAKRTNATSEAALRSAAERLQDPDVAYVDCAVGASYSGRLPPPPAGFGYTTKVRYWDEPDTSPSATVTALEPGFRRSCHDDAGLQLITVSLTDDAGRRRSIEIMKRRQ